MAVSPYLLKSLEWRCIGPPRGGRVVAVAGDPSDSMVFYFGACAGGIWKTTDGGAYWENISDGFFNTASVGAIAVSESDPNVLYAGMGESCIRLNVSHGDGVYRSRDAGKTWTNVGLQDTRHIARVRIHPRDPDLVYVAALGHAFGPNKERGVFRSRDGGRSWEKSLFRNETTGAIDLSLDPLNSRVLYVAMWQVRRTPWSLESGGPGSGIFKSVDGGDSWKEISSSPGLPGGLKGRIGIAVSPAKSGRVWATIEAEKYGLYRSDDGGDTWELATDNSDLQGRPWYYQHLFADPQDPDAVWILNYKTWKSVDSGKTFSEVTTPHGDNHDLWIDPQNPLRMIEGNDGGACVSFNGGATWSTIYNQLTAQFYHVTTDNQFPYRVYGTQQDNSAISVPSRSNKGGIPWGDCYAVGGSESGYIVADPRDPNVVISGAVGSSPGGGGNLLRYDKATGQVRIITVWPELTTGRGAREMRYRFPWTFPILFSPHDPNTLYVSGNRVFQSRDQGGSWEAISPDLTRNDASKMGPSGGPVTKDTSGAEVYGTLFTFAESTLEKGLFWAGSDDGLVHVSRDGGRSWQNITPSDVPEWTLISVIEPSPHDPATAYLAATRYKLDDPRPMLYKTRDFGRTWTRITDGIPAYDFTRVIREDPARRGLLYAGTETGAYVSFDDGASWQSMQANLPRVPVYDLMVKDGDLVAATHGRSFWILDDLTSLHQLGDEIARSAFYLLKPRPTYRVTPALGWGGEPGPGKKYDLSPDTPMTFYEVRKPTGGMDRVFLDAGRNPPDGVIVHYYLEKRLEGELRLEFMEAGGRIISTFSSKDADEGPRPAAEAGMNRFVWDTRYPPAHKVPGDKSLEDDLKKGPLAPPGEYRVNLTVEGRTHRQDFRLLKDPRVDAVQEDFDAQFRLLLEIRDKLSETHDSVIKLRSIRKQVDEWVERAKGRFAEEQVSKAASDLKQKLGAIEEGIIQVGFRGARDRLNLPVRLDQKLSELSKVVASADFAPTKQAREVFHEVSGKIDQQLAALERIVDTDVAAFNELVEELDLPAIVT